MNSESKITRTILHNMGYRKADSKTEFGYDWYFKRRLTRAKRSRCTVQVEFNCNGLVNVNAIEKRVVKDSDSPTGQDYSDNLRTVNDLREWENFAFCY